MNVGMDKKDRDRLQEQREFLLDNITDVKGLIDGLLARKIITPRMKDDIMAKETLTDRLRELLDTLPRRGSVAFQALLDVLVHKEEYDAAIALCPELADKHDALNTGSASQLQPHQDLHSLAEDPDELPEVWPQDNVQPITVTPVTDETMKTKYASAARDGPDNAFSLQNGRILLIINNSEFSPESELKERIGSGKDEEALEKLFHQLDFEVIVKRNRSAEEMLQDVSETCKRQPISCFACAILSHGGKECIFGADGEKMFLNDLLHAVSNEMSPNLKGKPKLFFIQACQGNNYVVVDVNQADFVSFRHTMFGSWFIQAVVFVISKLAHKMELNHLMLRVNRLVGRARAGGYEQIAVFDNTMTKEFYFFPGLLKR